MIRLGATLAFLGFGSVGLYYLDYHFILLMWADTMQPGFGVVLGALGLVVLAVAALSGRGRNAQPQPAAEYPQQAQQYPPQAQQQYPQPGPGQRPRRQGAEGPPGCGCPAGHSSALDALKASLTALIAPKASFSIFRGYGGHAQLSLSPYVHAIPT